MSLDESLRRAARIRRGDYDYIVHPLLDGVPRVTAELLEEWLDWASTRPMLDDATLIVAPEAMALPLAATLTLETGLPYVVARKRSYGMEGERTAEAATGYGSATLHLNDVAAGDRVVLVDDVVSTGATLRALLATVRAAGATVLGIMVAVDKSDGTLRWDIPLEALRRVRLLAGRVDVAPH